MPQAIRDMRVMKVMRVMETKETVLLLSVAPRRVRGRFRAISEFIVSPCRTRPRRCNTAFVGHTVLESIGVREACS